MSKQAVALLSLTECQIDQQIVLDLGAVSGDNFFEDIGDWMMQSLAHIHTRCEELNITPCIHLETLTMERPNFITFMVGAFLDDLGIVHTQ